MRVTEQKVFSPKLCCSRALKRGPGQRALRGGSSLWTRLPHSSYLLLSGGTEWISEARSGDKDCLNEGQGLGFKFG